ncbi:hypothetical protein [Embleya sp. AB8]|uniref:hypothetical protein n=1 Tax=Embleya sp. AB8 TaxID=3156304 RepID=UPI003C73E12B
MSLPQLTPQHPPFRPHPTFRPFVPHTHTLDADHEPADPTRPITLRALYSFGDPTGRPQLAAETWHLTLPQAATLYRMLRDSLLAAGLDPEQLGATV